VAVTAILAGLGSAWTYWRDRHIGLHTATIDLNSTPGGATMLVDGVQRGKAPLSLALTPGRHEVVAKSASGSGRAAIDVVAGRRQSVMIPLELGTDPGHLDVSSDPPGAEVLLDGVAQGRSPVSISDIPPGEHVLVVDHGAARLERTLMLAPAERLTVFVPLAGWVTVRARVPLDVFERARRLGSSREGRILVPAGRRRLQLVNTELGVNTTQEVVVMAGQLAELTLPLPAGLLSVTSDPAADVWVDGESRGRTPTGNLSVPIGEHEVIVSDPALGDQRLTVLVGLGAPTRLSVKLGPTDPRVQRGSPKRSGISAAR
jgi:hypothetical protein